MSRVLLFASAITFSCLLFSCTKDPYLYDRAGFESGNRPKNVQANENSPNKVAPDYYYRQPAPNQGYQQPQQQQYQPPQQYAPQGYNPAPQQYSAQPYQYQQQQPYYPAQGYGQQPSYQQAGSRFYSNPYAIPPTSSYPYYDADQYYVPPSYSANAEYQSSSSSSSSPRPDVKN